jgi:hypothetical protein
VYNEQSIIRIIGTTLWLRLLKEFGLRIEKFIVFVIVGGRFV